MLHFKSRRAFSLVAIATVSMAAVPYTRTSAGYTFDMETTTTVQSMMPGAGGNMKMTARGMVSSKGIMRMEVLSSEGSPMYANGDYFLTGDGKAMLVKPATKTYIDLADMATTAMANMPPEVAAQMVIADIKGETQKLADGTPIEGRATDHYRTNMSYSMSIMGQTLPTTIVTDYWVAKVPVKFSNPLVGGTKSPLATGPMAELVKKQIEIMPKFTDEVPLKTTAVTTVSVMGQSIVTSMSSEMKNFKEGDVDDAKFVVPEGYTKATKP